MISPVSLAAPPPGAASRVRRALGDDLAAYRRGLERDLHDLATDSVAWWLAVCVLLSQLLDGLSTFLALTHNWPEGNPLTAAVIGQWGLPGLFIEKVVIATTVVWNMARLRGRGAWALGAGAVLVGLAAVAWNLHLVG